MDAAPPLFLVFRPMVDADGEAAATDDAAAMQARLEAVPGVSRVDMASPPQPYWKIEATWEITFHLHLDAAQALPLAGVFACIVAFQPAGWTGDFAADTSDGGRWAVWNRPAELAPAALLLPTVVWAELCTWDGVAYTGPFESADDGPRSLQNAPSGISARRSRSATGGRRPF